MLHVTIELWPHGDRSRAKVLGTADIANVGGTLDRGNYFARVNGQGGRKWKATRIAGFPRNRLLAWDLLYRVLREVVGERNQSTEGKL